MFKEEWFASKEYTLEHFQRIFLLQQQQPFVRLKLLLIQSFTDLLTSVWQTTRSWKSVLVCFAHTIMGLCRDHARATCSSSDVKTVLFILLAALYYGRSSTGYGTRRARGGRYVHLQHRARTGTDYTDSAGRDMQRLYFLCYLMLNVLTCYIKWWWPDAAAAASSGRVSKYHFTEQENCWKQFLLKLFEVHYDYTSI